MVEVDSDAKLSVTSDLPVCRVSAAHSVHHQVRQRVNQVDQEEQKQSRHRDQTERPRRRGASKFHSTTHEQHLPLLQGAHRQILLSHGNRVHRHVVRFFCDMKDEKRNNEDDF